jgi:hypothetical protein
VGLHSSAERLGRIKALDRLARPAATAVKGAVPPGWRKDLLSGSWLGHPLNPLLTDIPVGALTSGTVLDLMVGRRRQDAADALVALGVISALPTMAAGAADWSDTFGPEKRVGVVHAGGATALLYRSNGRICAIGSRCSHAGGPLEEGDID